MEKYRRYKNSIEKFLASEKGKRILNICYSWGASIVILGALFKLLHFPYANQILFISLITESLVFFISGFDKPFNEYHWEDVFPELTSKNPSDNAKYMSSRSRPQGLQPGSNVRDNTAPQSKEGEPFRSAGNLDVSEEDVKNFSDSLKKFSQSAEQMAQMAEMAKTSSKYIAQMNEMTKGINFHSEGYAQQMEMLNRNISGLNTIFEIQLKGVSSQIESIEHINNGLNRIRDMYDHSVMDSSVFHTETEEMARKLSQLNQVYARLLQAMTVNMPPANYPPHNPAPQPPTDPYQQPYGYQQEQGQAPYTPGQPRR
ncbi:MAG: gliding motility protein GldL [Massilibacteroides sp.]|nr:gliding motility protein GldL [Massilibacteroides sp.]